MTATASNAVVSAERVLISLAINHLGFMFQPATFQSKDEVLQSLARRRIA